MSQAINNSYAVSRYNVFIPLKKNRVLTYNGFSGGMALWEAIEKEVFTKIENGRPVNKNDQKIVRPLVYGGFIVDKDFDEREDLEKQYRIHRYNHNIMTLTIAPTLMCNFACDYCYQGKEKNKGSMKVEVQDAVVALAQRAVSSGIKHLHVAWYGGEPLLGKKIIKSLSQRFIEICDQRGVQYDAMMVTNGYLLDAATMDDLGSYRVKTIQVTFDGPPADHDARRVLHSGKPTFERIVDNFKASIDRTKIRFSTRVNIDSRNIKNIPELFDLLRENGLANKPNFGIYLSPVEAMTQGCQDIAGVCLGKLGYGQQEADLYRLCFEKGLTKLPYPPRFHGGCAAVKPNGLVIIPNGDIHKCWHTVSHPERKTGSVFKPEEVREDSTYAAWLDWNPFDDANCKNCKLLPVCTGACGYKFLYAEDTRGEAASLPCISWKYNIHERLVLRAEKAGVIKPEDYDKKQFREEL